MNLYSADYCRAVLTADEKWRLNLLIQNVRRWSIFGIDFEGLREAWDRPLFQPILREELASETHRDFVNESPWMGSNNDRPEVRRATLELWESLNLNSGLSRLEFFVEFGKRSTDISRLASAVWALQRGEPTEGQLCETRLNPWCRSVVERYLKRKQSLESQQVATIG